MERTESSEETQGVMSHYYFFPTIMEYRKWMNMATYLEDHPRTCKWLTTMVIVSPLTGVIPLINSFSWLINGGY